MIFERHFNKLKVMNEASSKKGHRITHQIIEQIIKNNTKNEKVLETLYYK